MEGETMMMEGETKAARWNMVSWTRLLFRQSVHLAISDALWSAFRV